MPATDVGDECRSRGGPGMGSVRLWTGPAGWFARAGGRATGEGSETTWSRVTGVWGRGSNIRRNGVGRKRTASMAALCNIAASFFGPRRLRPMIAIKPTRVEGPDGVDRAEVYPDRLVLIGPGGTFVISFRDTWREKTSWLPQRSQCSSREAKTVASTKTSFA